MVGWGKSDRVGVKVKIWVHECEKGGDRGRKEQF